MQTTGDLSSIGPTKILAGLAGIPCILLGTSPVRSADHAPPLMEIGGRPVAKMALDLGVTMEQFRAAFEKVRRARTGEPLTHQQRRANRALLAEGLGISLARLDEVMDQHRPRERKQT